MTAIIVKVVLLVLMLADSDWVVPGAKGEELDISGRYELLSPLDDPTYDAYLEALGVGQEFRIIMTKVKINLDIEKLDRHKYKFRVVTPVAIREATFEFGKELSDKFIDSRPYKTTFTLEGNTIKQTLVFSDGHSGVSLFEFSPGEVIAKLTSKDKTTIRKYKRV